MNTTDILSYPLGGPTFIPFNSINFQAQNIPWQVDDNLNLLFFFFTYITMKRSDVYNIVLLIKIGLNTHFWNVFMKNENIKVSLRSGKSAINISDH